MEADSNHSFVMDNPVPPVPSGDGVLSAAFFHTCEVLGISPVIGRFLLCFFASIAAGYVHRFLRDVRLRHLWAAVSGAVLSYIAFGAWANVHFAVPVVFAYVAMLADRKNAGVITAFGSFAFLIVCHVLYMSGDAWKAGGIDFTGSLMILTLKVTSCAFNYADGALPPEVLKEAHLRAALARCPSLLEFFGYTLCCGTHFAGPVYEMKDYLAWTERKGEWSEGGPDPPPSPYGRAAVALLQGLASVLVYLPLVKRVDLALFGRPEYMLLPLWRRVALVMFASFVARWKYYFIWSVSEAAMCLSGLGFTGWKQTERGKVATWARAKNCDILGVELATSSNAFPLNWNISVSNWLRVYVYERLTPKGKKAGFEQLMMTQIVSAVWHGLYPGYMLYFMGTAIMINGSRVIYRFQKALPPDSLARRMSDVLHGLYAGYVNNYAAVGFLILSGQDTLRAYRGVWFSGTLLPLLVMLLGQLVRPPRQPRPAAGGKGSNGEAAAAAGVAAVRGEDGRPKKEL